MDCPLSGWRGNIPGTHDVGGPAFDLADTTNAAGCPVLRVPCEGREPQIPGAAQPRHDKQHGTTASYPPLQRTQGRGTHSSGTGRKQNRLGHPSVLGVTMTGTCGKSADGICRRDRRDVSQFFRRDANLKEIHSRLVTSDLAHSPRFVP